MPDDTATLCEIIRGRSSPLEPLPTDVTADLRPLSGILAVMFDVYGTLFISRSGDVGTAREAARSQAAAGALRASGVELSADRGEVGRTALDLYFSEIEIRHREARSRGVEFPEVLIEEVWRSVINRLEIEKLIRITGESSRIARRVSAELECRQNPTWPMPDVERVLDGIRGSGRMIGIVSNAQFFTPLLFEAHFGKTPGEMGFDSSLMLYSYEHGTAKPGTRLFELARERLEALDIPAGKVLYVGNDMLNDIRPAAEVGFRTCLFAGDARSLRLREGELAGVYADRAVAGLGQLLRLMGG